MDNSWTEHEKELLRLNFETVSHADLAIILGRSENAVRNMCWKLDLRKKEDDWTAAEEAVLRAAYDGETPNLAELERALGRHRSNISRKARSFGLTKPSRQKTEAHRAQIAANAKDRIAKNGHTRGMLGHTHTDETRAVMSAKSLAAWADPDSVLNSETNRQRASDSVADKIRDGSWHLAGSPGYSRGRAGKREDLGGLYVRSRWEANYARYLNFLVAQGQVVRWEYEPDTYEFHKIKRGSRFYTPDFKVWETVNQDEFVYHEVKGWMDQKSRTKLDRMARYYPHIRVLVIGKEEYRAMARAVKSLVPNWE